MNRYENFECHTLDEDGNLFFCGELPEHLRFDAQAFETLWHLHPQEYHVIKMHGRPVATARSHAKSRRRAIPTPNINVGHGNRSFRRLAVSILGRVAAAQPPHSGGSGIC